MKSLAKLLLLLTFLYITLSVPQSCNGGGGGNALEVETEDAQIEEAETLWGRRRWSRPAFRRPAWRAPAWRRPAFRRPTWRAPSRPTWRAPTPSRRINAFRAPWRAPTWRRPSWRAPTWRRPNFQRPIRVNTPRGIGRGTNSRKPGFAQVDKDRRPRKDYSEADFEKYKNGGGSGADEKEQKKVEDRYKAKRTTGGKFVFVELPKEQMDKCLGSFFFCSVDCSVDFDISCKNEAKIYSVFVDRKQHAEICVKPRAIHPIRRVARDPEYREQCVLRPCPCSQYESWFVKAYGQKEYDEGMKMIQGQCQSWCSSGKKPTGVIDSSAREKILERNKKNLLDSFAKEFRWLNKFLILGEVGKAIAKFFKGDFVKGMKVAGKAIADTATKAGKAIAGTATKAGKAIAGTAKKAGRAIAGTAKKAGKAIVGGAKKVGTAFRSVGRRISGGFRRAGRSFRRFFRRRW